MAERTLIVAELKRALRERGLTYAAVASKLGLSVATVKRLFSSGDFSLQRVDLICELLGVGWREILERAHEHDAPTKQLTLTQEQEIVSDPKLLFVTWLVLNRTSFDEILQWYRLTRSELLRLFIRLDRLKVIELQPANRVRLLVSRRFSWRPAGPVARRCPRRHSRSSSAPCRAHRANACRSSSRIGPRRRTVVAVRSCWRSGPGPTAVLRSSTAERDAYSGSNLRHAGSRVSSRCASRGF